MPKTKLYHLNGIRHNGCCVHMLDINPDTTVQVRSNMWGSDSVMIGRFADMPWEALKAWLEYEDSYLEWYELWEAHIN